MELFNLVMTEDFKKAIEMVSNKEWAGAKVVDGKIEKIITFGDERRKRLMASSIKKYRKVINKQRICYRKCCICGFKKYVELHHIIPIRLGCESDKKNLLPLCPNHHKLLHKNFLSDDEKLKLKKYILRTKKNKYNLFQEKK